MTRLILIAAFYTALLSLPLAGGSVRLVSLTWDKNPEPDVVRYELYRGLEKIGESALPPLKIAVPFSECVVAVRAVNSSGLASPMSAPLTIPSVWSEVQVTLQFSADLKDWKPDFTPEARYARAKIETP
jgi:hypothetical protein